MGRNPVGRLSELRPLRLDTVAAIGGLLIALVLFPLRFFASQVYLNTVPVVLGTACILYLVRLYYQQQATDDVRLTLPSRVTMALPTAVLLGLAALVVLTVHQGARTISFFALASVVGALVVGQICFASDRDFNARLLLLQIVLFALVVRGTALYATPGFIGIDVWTHMGLTEQIVSEGRVGAISHDKHYASPFYHLLVTASSMLFDVSLRSALYLSLGLVMPISVLLVYAGGNLLVSQRWATLAAALYALASHVSMWGLHLIPTSMGLVFFLAMLYALLRVMRIEYTTRDFALLLLSSVAVILTHQVSTFIMLVLLLAAFVAQLVFEIGPLGLTRLDASVFRTKKPVNLLGLVVFNVGLTIFVWSLTPYRDDSFLETVLRYFSETLKESAGFLNIASGSSGDAAEAEAAEAATTLLDELVPYIDELGFLILLAATFVGCLYIVHRRRAEQSVFTLLLATAFMLVFVMGFPMFGIHSFIPNRWFAFLYAPMAILGAIGLRTLDRGLAPALVVVVLLLFTLVYPGAMLFATESNIDNPVFEEHHEQLAYTESELAAVGSIGEMTGAPDGDEIRPDQRLYTDHPYQTLFSRTGAYPSTDIATVPEGGTADHNYAVYRTTAANEAVYFNNADGQGRIEQATADRLCRPDQATVYTNGDVTMCTPSPATE
ncbi:glycosyltransferase family 39 protein [Haloterrigena sp. SYSU A558-1]|uniref:Glycosyltransferase family 39 protein n=1 Tax=Haloterrigena gelatinilytica TaxID=2741724 RepID=A0A8J8GP32_9EURY|nr:glycosyltransferase family 39 protein [Haloterrigena gelatinilytica]NUB91397.1 glycosyltransferase family 39 protein [Haloterrigena gelatinilytica]NUC72865.1 glycosyltransferase family 39 protein [Haloterrigena gelatinilytica]